MYHTYKETSVNDVTALRGSIRVGVVDFVTTVYKPLYLRVRQWGRGSKKYPNLRSVIYEPT